MKTVVWKMVICSDSKWRKTKLRLVCENTIFNFNFIRYVWRYILVCIYYICTKQYRELGHWPL